MQVSTRHWYALSNLLFQGGKAGIGDEPGFDAVTAQGLDLRGSIGGIAVLQHALCGYCDAGWHGSKLTLELHSLRRSHSVPLYPGLKIGQLVFYRMDHAPERSYAVTGRYNGDSTVTASKG